MRPSSARISAVSLPRGRPDQRRRPGVADRRAMRPCMGMPSRSATDAPGAEVGIGGEVGHRVDGQRRRRGRPRTPCSTSSDVRSRHPGGDALVDLVAVLDAAGERREAGIVTEPDQLHHPLGHRLGRRADGDPPPVGAAVGAARDRVGDARARGGAGRSRARCVRRHERAHHLEQRLVEVDVDHLADPAVHGGQRGERGHHGGDLVGQGDRRQERAAVGLAVERGEAAHGLGQGGEAGTVGVGAVLAEAA